MKKWIYVVLSILIVIILLLVLIPKKDNYSGDDIKKPENPFLGDLNIFYSSSNVAYDNTDNDVLSNNVQDAIDELYDSIVDGCYVGYTKGTSTSTEYKCNKSSSDSSLEGEIEAENARYDNSNGLIASNVQMAIDELASKISYCRNGFHKDNETSSGYDCLINTLPSTLSITNNVVNLTYGGSNEENAYTYDGDGVVSCTSSDTTKVTCNVDTTTNKVIVAPAGATTQDVTITVKASETVNYYAPTPVNFSVTVNKAASSITCKSAQNWTGSAITAYSASSHCASYTNGAPTAAGTYTVTCNGETNYADSTCSFTINKVKATLTCANRTYTGNAQNMYSNATGCSSVTNGSQTNAGGPWTLTCVPDDNHTAPSTCTATMNKAASSITCKSAQNWTGSAITAYSASSHCASYTNGAPSAAGTYTVTCNGATNYANSTCSFTINKVKATLTCANRTYTGSAQNMYSNATGCSSVTNGSQTNAGGPWTLTCNPDGNHTAPSTCTATMNPAASSITCKSAQNWTGSAITSYSASSHCASITNNAPSAAGTYTVTCNPATNYAKSTCSFTINKVKATLTCANRTYTGSAQNMYSNATGCSSVTNGSQTNAGGPWTLTCNPDGNHTAPSTCTATMSRKAGNISLNATSGSVCNNASTSFTVKSHHGGSLSCSSSATGKATCSVSGSTVTVNGIAAGSATITVTSGQTTNYNAASATYTVTVNDCYCWTYKRACGEECASQCKSLCQSSYGSYYSNWTCVDNYTNPSAAAAQPSYSYGHYCWCYVNKNSGASCSGA